MAKVKTDWRNQLGEARRRLSVLFASKKEGPPPGSDAAKMLIEAATERFLKIKPRRGEIKQKSQLS